MTASLATTPDALEVGRTAVIEPDHASGAAREGAADAPPSLERARQLADDLAWTMR
jgi:hypothetical protein